MGLLVISTASAGCHPPGTVEKNEPGKRPARPVRQREGDAVRENLVRSDEEWQRILTPEQYEVLRKGGTEPRFTERRDGHPGEGIYSCAGCGRHLFASSAKYDSGSGWPSFFEPVDPSAIETRRDTRAGMVRTEVLCSRCGGHLGHVFDDGPPPTGLRYCINSVALRFVPADAPDSNGR